MADDESGGGVSEGGHQPRHGVAEQSVTCGDIVSVALP